MPKLATRWTPNDSGTATDDNAGFSYLLETGDHLLTETSFDYLLEDTVVSTKIPAIWAAPTKTAVNWETTGGFTTFTTETGDVLLTQLSDTIVTQAGDTRVFQDGISHEKLPAVWTDT